MQVKRTKKFEMMKTTANLSRLYQVKAIEEQVEDEVEMVHKRFGEVLDFFAVMLGFELKTQVGSRNFSCKWECDFISYFYRAGMQDYQRKQCGIQDFNYNVTSPKVDQHKNHRLA